MGNRSQECRNSGPKIQPTLTRGRFHLNSRYVRLVVDAVVHDVRLKEVRVVFIQAVKLSKHPESLVCACVRVFWCARTYTHLTPSPSNFMSVMNCIPISKSKVSMFPTPQVHRYMLYHVCCACGHELYNIRSWSKKHCVWVREPRLWLNMILASSDLLFQDLLNLKLLLDWVTDQPRHVHKA